MRARVSDDCSRRGRPHLRTGKVTTSDEGPEDRAEWLRRPTRLLFENAGTTAGIKVLDVGSGAGDVAFLGAELAGSTGNVVGVNMDSSVVAIARARASAAPMAKVSFTIGDVREAELDHYFDAVVGRPVLLYSADPIVTLRAAAGLLQEQGVAVFYEKHVRFEPASRFAQAEV